MIDARDGDKNSIGSVWISSSALSTGIISILIFFNIILVPLNNYIYYNEDPDIWSSAYSGLSVEDRHHHFYMAFLGFAIGIVTTGLLITDACNMLGCGIVVGQDVVGKISRNEAHSSQTDDITLTLKKGLIIGKIME